MILNDSERNRNRDTSVDRVTSRTYMGKYQFTVLTAVLNQQSMCAAAVKQGLPAAPCTSEEPGLALAGCMGSEESREVKVDG